MTFSETLKASIADFHLLKHPFYQDWQSGKLDQDTLREYAKNYYFHVREFPRYISATHSNCESLCDRRVLLENLADEEGFAEGCIDHPELWMRFAEGLGLNRNLVESGTPSRAIRNVISVFISSARSSYPEGLASLYAYEYQVPEVAATKIDGLEEHYGLADPRALSFFKIHQSADVYHRKACEDLLDQLSPKQQQASKQSAIRSAQALWSFLSSVQAGDHAA